MEENLLKVRLDKYLWAIRIFKTRSIANESIDKGRVKMNDESVKSSKFVKLGDEYTIRTEERRWKIKVINLLDSRKKYAEAINYYIDITPSEDLEINKNKIESSFNTGKRLSKTGRPTKKDRKDFDDFWDTFKENTEK